MEPESHGFRYGAPVKKPTEAFRMRKLIVATAALALLSSTALVSSTALAQDKAGAAPAASGDTMSKDTMSKKPMKKSKKTAKKAGDDTTKKE
jgi:pentapeptide MXKDX repeat protein